MARSKNYRVSKSPAKGTKHIANKHQGYQLPLPMWQDLVKEAARRKRLGLEHPSQNAIAVAAIESWLQKNAEGES